MTLGGSSFLDILRVHGGIVQSAETAIALVEAVARGLCGEEDLAQQQPLVAEEEGERWAVRSACPAERRPRATPIRAMIDRFSGEFTLLELPRVQVPPPPFLRDLMG